MAKAIEGAALLAGAVAMMIYAPYLADAAMSAGMFNAILGSLVMGGLSMEAGAIGDALTQNRGMDITTRQAASYRQIVYGEQRLGGNLVYESTTGSHLDQFNMIIVLATHVIDSIVNLYLDGRQVFWDTSSAENVTRNGVNFGGSAGGGTRIGPGGQNYNFDTLVFAEARFGDQANGDVMSSMTANDPHWAASASGSPYLGGMAYIYLKVEADQAMFPSRPEIRITVRGKNDIVDPRLGDTHTNFFGAVTSNHSLPGFIPGETVIQLGSGASGTVQTGVPFTGPLLIGTTDGAPFTTTGVWEGQTSGALFTPTSSASVVVPYKSFTTNWALIVADVLQDNQWGLGDVSSVNVAQLGTAANVCDEQITLGIGGTEANWACNWHYDTSTAPADVLQTMMGAAGGRLSRIGGEWFIWPAYYQGPTFTFGASALTGPVQWKPFRKQRDLFNRVHGTYIAPNYPYNTAGNLYDANGWYNGTIANNFPFGFTPTNYPQYAQDVLHGYSSDVWLAQDGGIQLPKEINHSCVLSVTQAQRAAKVALLRNRQQGSGSLMMTLQAFEMQPLDVMLMTFAQQGWSNKYLEVTSTKLTVDSKTKKVMFEVGVQDTDGSVYEWATWEELSVYDVPTNPYSGYQYVVQPPQNVLVASNSTTSVNNSDGIVTPRLLVSWAPAIDPMVVQYNIQYQVVGTTIWFNAPPVQATQTFAFVSGIVNATAYNVQVQSQRANGAVSIWVGNNTLSSAPSSTTGGGGATYTLSISPTSPTTDIGGSYTFFAAVGGGTSAVNWYVNGVLNGNNSTVGSISGGTYHASGGPGTFSISASLVAAPTVTASATIQVNY